jgi:hypothetical protein
MLTFSDELINLTLIKKPEELDIKYAITDFQNDLHLIITIDDHEYDTAKSSRFLGQETNQILMEDSVKHTLSFRILLVLAMIGVAHGKTDSSGVRFKVEALEVLGSNSPAWFNRAQTGEVEITELSSAHMKISPDGRWMLFARPFDSGLDIMTNELSLVFIPNLKTYSICEMALEAFFSPQSDYLFICTGPCPVIFDLSELTGTAIAAIPSGLESNPCWVHDWSADGKTIMLHQQASFGDVSNPRGWRIVLD